MDFILFVVTVALLYMHERYDNRAFIYLSVLPSMAGFAMAGNEVAMFTVAGIAVVVIILNELAEYIGRRIIEKEVRKFQEQNNQ